MTHHVLVLDERLVIATQGDEEKDTCHVLETVDPLPSFALLATDVNHEHFMVTQVEACLRHADRARTTLDDVLVGGLV
jgi:hypothetical protein